jgi:hypothetical protein
VGVLIVVVIIAIVIIAIAKGSSGAATSLNFSVGVFGNTPYDRLMKNGVPARGILLAVSNTGVKVGTAQRRFEQRAVYIDIEIPGRPPYEIDAQPFIPINLVSSVLPGATVELRVDANNPANIAIVGPDTGFAQQALRTA